MSKSLLVIHTPNHCGECACHVLGHEGFRYCCLSGHRLDDKDYCTKRLDSCPLKPIPLRKMTESIIYADGKEYLRTNVITEYDEGWNDCIDEILGEEKAQREREQKEREEDGG